MLNSMKRETLDRIIGTGIVDIRCQPILQSYDHKRRVAVRGRPLDGFDDGSPVPIWDFVVTRTDGTGARFHPDWGNKKISAMDCASQYEMVGPRNGNRGERRAGHLQKDACRQLP